jgi:ankyrin repeat protein
MAIDLNYLNFAEKILNKSIDIKELKNISPPIIKFVKSKEMIDFLISQGFTIEDLNKKDISGNNVLHYLMQKCVPDYFPLFEYLLKVGVNPNAINKNGHSPILSILEVGYGIPLDHKMFMFNALVHSGASLEINGKSVIRFYLDNMEKLDDEWEFKNRISEIKLLINLGAPKVDSYGKLKSLAKTQKKSWKKYNKKIADMYDDLILNL